MVISNLKFSEMGGGGGAFWSEIPERGFLENLDKNLLFSQKPACASQIVSHILRMWRLIILSGCLPHKNVTCSLLDQSASVYAYLVKHNSLWLFNSLVMATCMAMA